MRIGVFATGGTIAMRPAIGGGVVPADGAGAMLGGLSLPTGISIEQHDLFAKPSASIDLADVRVMAERVAAGFADGLSGAIITHGTDTLEETAFALALMLGPTRPVVVTGAMRSPDQAGADGPANLAMAIRVGTDPMAQGVLVLFGDEIHAAHLVRKVHSSRVHAFSSEPFGPVGHVQENVVHFEFSTRTVLPRLTLSGRVPIVPVIQTGLGLEAETIAGISRGQIDGLIVAGVGGGHTSSAAVPALEELARRIPVVITSRVGMGSALRATYAYAGGDIDLARRGLINGGRWRPSQARIMLQLALSCGKSPQTVFD